MKSLAGRIILVIHRYLGVIVGVLMTVWCLSGFVMMYQGFPALSEAERLRGLAPLDLTDCCDGTVWTLDGQETLGAFRIEMLTGRPVLRSGAQVIDLRTGRPIAPLSADEIAQVARTYAAGAGVSGEADIRIMDRQDQWTIQTFARAAPLHHVRFNDPAGSEIYVSGSSGLVVQDTTRHERFWTWLGAVPHWLYPTLLRQNGALWTQVVIWTSVLGVFLTATGLYVGISRFRRRRDGRWSPFRGLWYWHHMIGLVFGVITLTWTFSGLMTMGPWGVLDGPPNPLRRDISGAVPAADMTGFIDAAARAPVIAGGDVRQLRSAPLGGRLRVLAMRADDEPIRLDETASPRPPDEAEVRAALATAPLAELEWRTREDAYHYGFKSQAVLPVWRARFDDALDTHAYIHPDTGEVVRLVDDASRRSRWLRNGLHSLDFIRGRPVWDVVTLLLLAGVTLVCATGAWMSFRRIRRDVETLRFRSRR